MLALGSDSIDRLTGGQVITDLKSAVKELVENSLDAGAVRIDVRLTQNGVSQIVVTDDGEGIEISDRDMLVQRHCTSKLRSFDDLQKVTSFGFRGEALAALCALSGSFQVITRSRSDSVGEMIQYRKDGSVASRQSAGRSIGTTITIHDLFATLPVRRQAFIKNIKRQVAAAIVSLQSYALLSAVRCGSTVDDASARITMWSDGRCILKSTSGSGPMAPVSSMFGSDQAAQIQLVDIALSDAVRISGWISKPVGHSGGNVAGRSAADRQFWGVNRRPVDLSAFSKALNTSFRSAITCKSRYPVFVLNLTLPTDTYDINVTPDKRVCLLHDAGTLLEKFSSWAEELYAIPNSALFETSQTRIAVRSPSHNSEPVRRLNIARNMMVSDDTNEEGVPSVVDPKSGTKRGQNAACAIGDARSSPASLFGRAVAGNKANHEENSLGFDPMPGDSIPHNVNAVCVDVLQADDSAGLSENDFDGDHLIYQDDVARGPKRALAIQRRSHFDNIVVGNDHLQGGSSDLSMCPEDINDTVVPFVRAYHRANGNPISAAVSNRDRESLNENQRPQSVAAPSTDREFNSDCYAVRSQSDEEPQIDSQPLTAPTSGRLCFNTEPKQTASKVSHVRGRHVVLASSEKIMECGSANDEDIPSPKYRKTALGTGKRIREFDNRILAKEWEEHDDDDSYDESEDSEDADYIPIDLAELSARYLKLTLERVKQQKRYSTSNNNQVDDADIERCVANIADEELTKRRIQRENFAQMEIIGQFNLGFIVVRFRDDLFIIDQHASNEKFNYETLIRTSKFSRQRLISPMVLKVDASTEIIVIDNIDVFRRNGFEIEVDDDAEPCQRLRLIAVPQLQNVSFSADDIVELASRIVSDREATLSCAIPKLAAALASRACRMSIMIGDHLSKTQMSQVVRELSTLQQPWNCPHGRPTMRHLFDLVNCKK